MHFVISREMLLAPLNLVTGVVERRQTMPILANALLTVENNSLSITGTDLEVELIGQVKLEQAPQLEGQITVSARKLNTICKSLPDGCDIEFCVEGEQLIIRSNHSQFALATLAATDFPSVVHDPDSQCITLNQGDLKQLIERTRFAMAQQDVRYYLNGMLWEIQHNQLRLVATDGHRLAMCTLTTPIDSSETIRVILPYKGVTELAKLLLDDNDTVELFIGSKALRATTPNVTFTSKLVDGKFPDYDRVIPRSNRNVVSARREALYQALSRVAILANEKYRGVRLAFANDALTVVANNAEQEQAEEKVSISYHSEPLEIGFNVNYLLDALSALSDEAIQCSFSDAGTSVLLEEERKAERSRSIYVIMPMRL